MADSRQAAKVVLVTRFEWVLLTGVVAVTEAGPVLATVDQADIRGLITTRLLYVAELLRSRLEYSAKAPLTTSSKILHAVVAPLALP